MVRPKPQPQPQPEDQEWFVSAVEEAPGSARAKAIAEAKAVREANHARVMESLANLDKQMSRVTTSTTSTIEAFERFAKVAPPPPRSTRGSAASGSYSRSTRGSNTGGSYSWSATGQRVVTPDEALEALVEGVKNSPDPFVASGEWITKVTNALSEVARQSLEE